MLTQNVDLVVMAPNEQPTTASKEGSLDQAVFYGLKTEGESGGLEMEKSLMAEGKGVSLLCLPLDLCLQTTMFFSKLYFLLDILSFNE
jgi:hypothetical protein